MFRESRDKFSVFNVILVSSMVSLGVVGVAVFHYVDIYGDYKGDGGPHPCESPLS